MSGKTTSIILLCLLVFLTSCESRSRTLTQSAGTVVIVTEDQTAKDTPIKVAAPGPDGKPIPAIYKLRAGDSIRTSGGTTVTVSPAKAAVIPDAFQPAK